MMIKRYLCRLAVIAAVFAASQTVSAKIVRTTVTFDRNLDLKLDRYEDDRDTAMSRPAIIFAFGGGFSGGARDHADYMPYFNFMAEQGFVVCSVDYRTALAGYKPAGGDNAVMEFGTALAGAVRTATTDFLTATAYVLANAAEWRVNPQAVIASGSSAGAITALEAEQLMALGQVKSVFGQFNYAAVVSFAGALMSAGEPAGLDRFCPTMLFQGDADANVPYDAMIIDGMGLYGSRYLATRLKEGKVDGAFYTVLGADHSMAISPMRDNLYDILGFLRHVLDGGPVQFAWTTVTLPGSAAYRTDFGIDEYIMNNMP